MTMQFLASVRRNQRQWMVVLTILAIFAFLFDDVRGAKSSGNSIVLIIAVLCAAGMSIIGYPRQHTVLYGFIGFLVGGSAAWIGLTYAGPKPLALTSFGSLSREKLNHLQSERSKGNRFMQAIVQKVNKEGNAPSFGDTGLATMVNFSVLKHEANRMGVAVSDEAVSEYIQEATQKKMSEKDYLDALQETEIGESQLFDIVRGELEVRLVQSLLFPPANYQFVLPRIDGRYSGRTMISSPMQLWDTFSKLHVREDLSAIAIPVPEFKGQVPEPSETELREYFDRRKGMAGDDRGNPGFLEPPKVKLAYIMASDVELYEKGLPSATDQEVVDYYTAHKEEYRVFDFPEPDETKLPELKNSADAAEPADAISPANVTPEGPAPSNPPATDKPAADKPATDDKEAGKTESQKKEDPKKEDQPSLESKAKEEPKCGDEANATKDPAQEDAAKPAADEKDTPKPDATPEKVEAKKDDAKDSAPAPSLPAPGKDEDMPKMKPPGVGPMAPQFGPMAPPRYRELNDDLKLEIREKILLGKVFAKMGDAADEALQFMFELSTKYMSAEKSEQPKLAESFAKECEEYAKKKGMEYHETKGMSRFELMSSFDERIGSAGEAVSERSSRQNIRQVAELVFEPNANGRGYRIPLFAPQRADSPKAKYAYWKIAEISPRVPDLGDQETRQLVVDSWKYEKARELAGKRASELAELIKKTPDDIAGALSGQTINGTKESPAVAVRENPKFSWLRVSQSVPTMGGEAPMESFLPQIDQPGSDFFKLVFDQLTNGEVGIALNRPRTTYYVVRVHDRDGTGADGGVELQELQSQFLKTRFTSFFPTAYDYLAGEAQQIVDSRWQRKFNDQFGITFGDPTVMESEEEQ